MAEGDIVSLATDGTFRLDFGNYVVQIVGLLHPTCSLGKVRSGKGGKGEVELPRTSFAPLAFALLESEKTDSCVEFTRWYEQWLRVYSPKAHAKLMQCSVTINDFKESGERALRVLCASPPVHRHCAVHMIRNCTQAGYTGWKKLRSHKAASTLRQYLLHLQHASSLVVFDMLSRHLLLLVRHELEEAASHHFGGEGRVRWLYGCSVVLIGFASRPNGRQSRMRRQSSSLSQAFFPQ
ncbi:unnamed protein product [Durusdinium trenchii]|uniref:MULE transposase domain-containing protein n=1 Tax=Durusdinium trenchii TaxID=1381693 RepID=A0ABP0NC79_9DINO